MSGAHPTGRRLRIRFAKRGKVRFVSHRDVARIWERGLRRAGLGVAYTEGFSPRPKLSFGLALSTGFESLGEYVDVNLQDDGSGLVDCQRLPAMLNPAFPVGIEAQVVEPLQPGAPSLQQAVTSCTWHTEVTTGPPGVDVGARDGQPSGRAPGQVAAAVQRVLAASEVMVTRERKGREAVEDIRPGILSLQVLGSTGRTASLEVELATQPRSLRPAELVRALDSALYLDRVVRTHQWTNVGGARQEVIPLPTAATPTRTPEARAS